MSTASERIKKISNFVRDLSIHHKYQWWLFLGRFWPLLSHNFFWGQLFLYKHLLLYNSVKRSLLCFRSQGSALSQKQMFGSNPDSPYIKFPPKFCLGRLINDSCPVPAGLSAVIYKVNPLVSHKLRHAISTIFQLYTFNFNLTLEFSELKLMVMQFNSIIKNNLGLI